LIDIKSKTMRALHALRKKKHVARTKS